VWKTFQLSTSGVISLPLIKTDMIFLLSTLAFILLLSVLIIIHELGHFMAARKAGVIVQEFGFGLPPKAKVLFKQGGTSFTINWIPFGGFVRLQGENALTEEDRLAKGSFGAASIPARIVILCAGVTMNFLLAIILLTFGFSFGKWIPTYLSMEDMQRAADRGVISMELAVHIDEVVSGGNAAKIGVPQNSILTAVNGIPVRLPDEVQRLQAENSVVTYSILSGEDFSEVEIFTVNLEDGKSGVVLSLLAKELSSPKRSLLSSLSLSLRETKIMTEQTIIGITNLFVSLAKSGKVPEGISGLVGIAHLTHVSVQQGFMTYLRLVSLLSLSLAVLNILPFPALDGGRLVFVIAEFIGRKPVNRRFELIVNGVGFLFLISVIFLITFYDIVRLF